MRLRHLHRRHVEGQALVFGALVLSLMLLMILTAVELSYHRIQRIRVENALAQSSRSAVQSVTYQAFADGSLALRDPAEVEALARELFIANLANVSALDATPDAVADQVQWTVLPNGGDCKLDGQTLHFTTPALCAELVAPLRGLFWPTFTPHIEAAETLDRLD